MRSGFELSMIFPLLLLLLASWVVISTSPLLPPLFPPTPSSLHQPQASLLPSSSPFPTKRQPTPSHSPYPQPQQNRPGSKLKQDAYLHAPIPRPTVTDPPSKTAHCARARACHLGANGSVSALLARLEISTCKWGFLMLLILVKIYALGSRTSHSKIERG